MGRQVLQPVLVCPQVKIVAPGLAPRRGNGGTLASRQALLHSLAHIENWAVDLSWGKPGTKAECNSVVSRAKAGAQLTLRLLLLLLISVQM